MQAEVLKAHGISKTYVQNKISLQVLHQVTISIRQGEFVVMLGRSGSGKSTLLNILAGLAAPSEGQIWVNGRDMFQLKDTERTMLRRENIGFIFQAYELLPSLTAMQNIRLPQLKPDVSYAKELLEALDMGAYAGFYPDQLSGGQQQRVSIARALINRPQVLLADEPTGNLDSKTERTVICLLKGLVKKYQAGILLVTHNESLIADADRVVRLEDGEIKNG